MLSNLVLLASCPMFKIFFCLFVVVCSRFFKRWCWEKGKFYDFSTFFLCFQTLFFWYGFRCALIVFVLLQKWLVSKRISTALVVFSMLRVRKIAQMFSRVKKMKVLRMFLSREMLFCGTEIAFNFSGLVFEWKSCLELNLICRQLFIYISTLWTSLFDLCLDWQFLYLMFFLLNNYARDFLFQFLCFFAFLTQELFLFSHWTRIWR